MRFTQRKKGADLWPAPDIIALFHIINKAVTAVISLIYHSEAAAVILIPEGEEIMVQQIHLQDGLFSGHGLEVELLYLCDAQVLFHRIRSEGGFFLYGAGEGILLQAPCQAGLVLADLSFNGSDGCIDGCEHIRGLLGCPEPGACTVNGQLHLVLVILLYRKYN